MKTYNDILADERPEYKAANYGFENLSNTELLSMIINRGAGTKESINQARQLMNMANGRLSNLAKLSFDEMQVVQGIGDCKALAGQKPDLGSSLAIYNYLHLQMADLNVEQAHILLMNQNFRLLKHVKLSDGGITETLVDVRVMMKEAVTAGATILALAHNHPSGNPAPSRADDELTRKVKQACDIMRIFFMDHVIVTDGNFYSYHDKGKL